MNWKMFAVIAVGICALGLLNLYPPWTFDGIPRGHSSIFRTAYMSVDRTRLLIQESIVVILTIGLAIAVRRKKTKGE